MDLSTPQLVITNPKPADKVKGVIKLEALAVDNVGIVKVEFWIDGALAATELLAPYSAQYDSNKLAKGDHKIFAVAVDAAGNKAQTAEISFAVDNSVILPPPPPPPPPSDTFWTVFPKADQTIYVSNSAGSDSANGLSEATAVKTLAKGFALLQPGNSHLLLKCGDVWRECFPYWNKSGASIDKPLLISSYGAGERPVVSAVQTMAPRNIPGATPGAPPVVVQAPVSGNVLVTRSKVDFVAVVGLHITDLARDPSSPTFNPLTVSDTGIRWQSTGQFFLLEDCKIDFHRVGFVTESPVQNGPKIGLHDLRLRRNVVVDNYPNDDGHSQGLYVEDCCQGFTLLENVIDSNGVLRGPPNAQYPAGAPITSIPNNWPTIFNHNIYTQVETTGLVAKGNILSRASATGIQCRSGGVLGGSPDEGNLFLFNPISFTAGDVEGAHLPLVGGVSFVAQNNYVWGGCDITPALPRGVGMNLGNAKDMTIQNNILANCISPTHYHGAVEYSCTDAQRNPGGIPLQKLTIQNNIIWHWSDKDGKNITFNGPCGSKATLVNNVVDGAGYPNPNRTPADYDPNFFAELRKLSKATGWNKKFQTSEILKFFRAGFGK